MAPGATTDESYTYDDNGNRDTANGDTYEIDPNNQLVSDGTYSYEYDAEGNITRSWAGNTYTQYHWDHRNRLIQVDSGFNGGPVFRSIEYRYDAQNQLIGRRVFLNGDTTASESQVFVHHNGQVVLQFDGTGNGDLDYNDLSHRYLWGPAVDMLLADEFIDTEQEYNLGEVTWPLADHLGSVRDVIDSAANVIDHAIYDSYGQLVEETSLATPFQWTGKYRDPLTGLQFNLNRWYNPELGRWMSEDPIAFAAGDANLGRYVGNEATGFVDVDGLAKARPGSIGDLEPGKQIDQELAEAVIQVIEEMRRKKWAPRNPRDPGEFGKAFDQKLSERLNANPNRGSNRFVTDVCVNEKGKVLKIGGGPGATGTTQIDVLYYKGNIKVGDTIDPERVLDVYDMKVGVIRRKQMNRIMEIVGKPVKPLQTPYKWTPGGWTVVEKVKSKLDFLTKIGLGFMVFSVIVSDVEACDVKELMAERRKAGSDQTLIGLWAFGDLKTFIEKAGVDESISYWIALYVYDQQIGAFSAKDR